MSKKTRFDDFLVLSEQYLQLSVVQATNIKLIFAFLRR